MNPQTVNALELLMLSLYVIVRVAGTAFIVWAVVTSDITNGFKTILAVLAIIVGLGFNFRYQNPNTPCDPQHCLFTGDKK